MARMAPGAAPAPEGGYCRTCVTAWALCTCCLVAPEAHHMATACALPTGHDGDHDWADPPRITCFTAESGRAGYRLEGGAMPPDWATRVAARGRTAWCEITVYDDTHVGVWGGEVWPSAYPALFATTGTPEYPRGTAQSPAGFQVTAAGQALLAAARAAKAVR